MICTCSTSGKASVVAMPSRALSAEWNSSASVLCRAKFSPIFKPCSTR
jgi:hypothetical protein